jgi:NADPH:quinone reductase-like Zn-dependent oxidoreductase
MRRRRYGSGVYLPPAMRECVCFLYADMGGELKPIGTAFFLDFPVDGVHWTFVVTALHVVANAQKANAKTFLRVNTKDGGFRVVEVTAEKWIKPDVSDENGHITSVGDDVTDWSVGDQVCALLASGGYADEVAVPAAHVLPIPTGLSVIEASVLPEAACTVYFNLAMRAGLQTGQTALIHGARGGIGTFAIQWAAAIGATVITTAGSEAKTRIGQSLGATTAINYRTDDFVAATLTATDGRGVLDLVGADYLERNLNCLAIDGHLVIIGGNLTISPLNLGLLIFKGASVTATMLRPRFIQQKADIVAGVRRDVLPLIEAGAIRPVVDAVVPMRDAAQAHSLLESGSPIGTSSVITLPAECIMRNMLSSWRFWPDVRLLACAKPDKLITAGDRLNFAATAALCRHRTDQTATPQVTATGIRSGTS